MMNRSIALFVCLVLIMIAPAASAQIRITEWMYRGAPGEFVEFTNVGATLIDLTGWCYDDDSRINTTAGGAFDLGAFGIVAPGESVLITEAAPATFRAAWNLGAGVKVLGPYTNNLGRNDEINVFDNAGALVDRLTYGDETFPGSIRTQNFSGNIPQSALGTNNPLAAVLSSVGDGFGSYASTSATVGNPGAYVPEPGLATAALVGAVLLARRRAV
jgi:predicted extracellular nuclease